MPKIKLPKYFLFQDGSNIPEEIISLIPSPELTLPNINKGLNAGKVFVMHVHAPVFIAEIKQKDGRYIPRLATDTDEWLKTLQPILDHMQQWYFYKYVNNRTKVI